MNRTSRSTAPESCRSATVKSSPTAPSPGGDSRRTNSRRFLPRHRCRNTMSFLMIFRIAFKALSRNKMRTALTMLGMIIGVGAVITMVALGTGAQSSIESQIQSTGTNMIMVSAGNFTQGGVRQGQGNASTLTPDDANAIQSVQGVQYKAAGVNTRGQIVAGNMNWGTQIQGTDIDLPLIRSWPTQQ